MHFKCVVVGFTLKMHANWGPRSNVPESPFSIYCCLIDMTRRGYFWKPKTCYRQEQSAQYFNLFVLARDQNCDPFSLAPGFKPVYKLMTVRSTAAFNRICSKQNNDNRTKQGSKQESTKGSQGNFESHVLTNPVRYYCWTKERDYKFVIDRLSVFEWGICCTKTNQHKLLQ